MVSVLRIPQQAPSPSMRREWIEMCGEIETQGTPSSPSMRREWIEMVIISDNFMPGVVSLHAEGVD